MRRAVIGLVLLGALVTFGPGLGLNILSAEEAPATEGVATTEAHGDDHGDDHGGGHASPVTPVLLGLVIMLVAAKIFGELFERVHQPAVLGELIAGVVIGNLALIGFTGLDYLKTDLGITILAEIGVILLLFEVGMESNIKEMLSVGTSSLLVAILAWSPRSSSASASRRGCCPTRTFSCTSSSAPPCAPPVSASRRESAGSDLGKLSGPGVEGHPRRRGDRRHPRAGHSRGGLRHHHRHQHSAPSSPLMRGRA